MASHVTAEDDQSDTERDDKLKVKIKQNIFGSGVLFPEPPESVTGSHQSLPVKNDEGKTQRPPEGPPDGGWGWVIVVASFIMQVAVGLGFVAFGILYIDLVDQFGGQSGPVGWIGSIYMFVGHISSVPVSVFIDLYGCRVMAFVGCLIFSSGFFLSSFATNDIVLLFTYGIIGGVGFGAVYISCMVIVQQYFDKHRALAAGISSAGLSVGTISSGPLIQLLIDEFTWRGTVIIIAGIILHTAIAALLYRPVSQYCKPKSQSDENSNMKTKNSFLAQFKEKMFDSDIIKDYRFILICASGLFVPLSVTAFMMHTPKRAYYHGVDRHISSMLPLIYGTCTFSSRIMFGVLANLKCANRLLLYSLSSTAVCVIIMFYTMAVTLPWIIVGCIGFGLSVAGFTAVEPTALVDLVGIRRFPRAQSLYMIAFGTAGLIATPLVGYILDVTQDYELGFLITGGLGVVGGLLAMVVAFLDIHSKKLSAKTEMNCS